MYAITRLRSQLGVLAALAAAIGLYGAAIHTAFPEKPRFLPASESSTQFFHFSNACKRLVAARRDLGKEPKEKFGVLIGASTLAFAVDPLHVETGEDWRWLGLSAPSSNIIEHCTMAGYTLHGRPRPNALVLCVNLFAFENVPTARADRTQLDLAEFRDYLRIGMWNDAKVEFEEVMLVPWSIALPHRSRVSNEWRHTLVAARQDFFGHLGFDLESLYAPDPDPWSMPFPMPQYDQVPKKLLDRSKIHWRKHHIFSPSHYTVDGANVRALADLTRRARGEGISVVLVLLPESPEARSWSPTGAFETIRTGLARELGGKAPEILDYRALYDEASFMDPFHLKATRRESFTEVLSKRLREAVNR